MKMKMGNYFGCGLKGCISLGGVMYVVVGRVFDVAWGRVCLW